METRQREVARRSAVLPILVVYLVVRAFWIALDQGGRAFDSILASGYLKIGLWVVPCIALTMALNRLSLGEALREMGLGRGLRAGLLFGALAALPMAVAIVFGGLRAPGPAEVVGTSIVDPVAESVLFSGFLFSQLRRAQWRVATALIVSALMFGLAHLDGAELTVAGDVYRALLGLEPDMLWDRLRWYRPRVTRGGGGRNAVHVALPSLGHADGRRSRCTRRSTSGGRCRASAAWSTDGQERH